MRDCIIVFEKNPINRRIMAAMLAGEASSIRLPVDLDECLADLRAQRCDCLILDDDACLDSEQVLLRALDEQNPRPRLILIAAAMLSHHRWSDAVCAVLPKPVKPEALRRALSEPCGRPQPVVSEVARVLVVDDTPENLDYMIHALHKIRLETTVARNGSEALALIDAGAKFELILLDIRMPEMDGYETLRRLRRRGVSSIVVAVTAAQDTAAARNRFIGEGFDDFLAKPTPINQLLAIVEKYVNMMA